jgi:hypothetical protein
MPTGFRQQVLTADWQSWSNRPPTQEEVTSRDYHSWNREHFAIDTATNTIEENAGKTRSMLSECPPGPHRA